MEEQILTQPVQPVMDEATMRYFAQTNPPQVSDEVRKWQLDPEELLLKFENFLRMRYWDYQKKKYVTVADVNPLMNEQGIHVLMAALAAQLDPRTITLSNFTEDQVNRIACETRHVIRETLVEKKNEYGLKSVTEIRLIVHECDKMVYGVLQRAYMGGERRHQTQTHHTLEQVRSGQEVSPGMGNQKKGWFFK